MPAKFEIFKDRKGEFRFRLKATNGEIILASEGYKTKTGVKNGIASVQKNAVDETRFESKTNKKGDKFSFVLKAGNAQIVGVSETYDTTRACKAGMTSVAKNAPKAAVIDTTVEA